MKTMYVIHTSNFAKKTDKVYAICPEELLDITFDYVQACNPRLDLEIDTVEALQAAKVKSATAQ